MIALSDYELSLGEFLFANGENDVTHAGSVMKQVGNAHDQNAKMRFVSTDSCKKLRIFSLMYICKYRIAGKFGGAKFWRIAKFW